MHVALKCWWTPNRLCAAKNPQFYCYEILTLKFSFSNENIDPKHTIGFCSKLVSQKSKSIAHAQNLFNADDLNFMRAISFSGGRWGCSASLCHSDLSRKKEVNVCGICNMRKAGCLEAKPRLKLHRQVPLCWSLKAFSAFLPVSNHSFSFSFSLMSIKRSSINDGKSIATTADYSPRIIILTGKTWGSRDNTSSCAIIKLKPSPTYRDAPTAKWFCVSGFPCIAVILPCFFFALLCSKIFLLQWFCVACSVCTRQWCIRNKWWKKH